MLKISGVYACFWFDGLRRVETLDVLRPDAPTTPVGRLIFHVFGALDLIRDRTRAGLTAAATRGRRGGSKPVVTSDKLARAKTLIAKGLTVREAALRLKIGKTVLYEALIAKE